MSNPNIASRRSTRIAFAIFTLMLVFPYALLVLMSLGSGWTFPRLLPDRLDFAPWQHFFSDRDGMLQAVVTSTGISLTVATLATASGLLIGRAVRRSRSLWWRLAIYLPFVISPVIAGISLYDLLVRLQLTGTLLGVVLAQAIFAAAFSAVYFSELWSPRADRLETLVRSLGGSRWSVWRHAIFPSSSGLIGVCFLQTALYSWLDYGLVSIVGGGNVDALTTKLFAYIREASINQAAQASLVLLAPALLGFLFVSLVYYGKNFSGEEMAPKS